MELQKLIQEAGVPITPSKSVYGNITNGCIIKLLQSCRKHSVTNTKLAQLISMDSPGVTAMQVYSKITAIKSRYKVKKGKLPHNFASLVFKVDAQTESNSEQYVPFDIVTHESNSNTCTMGADSVVPSFESKVSSVTPISAETEAMPDVGKLRLTDDSIDTKSVIRDCNTLQYKIARKEKELKKITTKLTNTKAKFVPANYKPKNVKRRDTRHAIIVKDLNEKIITLQKSNVALKSKLWKLKRAQKSKYLHEKDSTFSDIRDNTKANKSNEKSLRSYVAHLEYENDRLMSALDGKVMFKNDKGIYSDGMRELILQLLALEVSSANISPVIQAVFSTVLDIEIPLSALPTRQSVVNISDEGQSIITAMYADKILSDKCTNIGFHSDGTSRQKIKILDSTISLDSGETLPMGFSKVAHETSAELTNHIKLKLAELEMAKKEHNVTQKMLHKLSYLMSDRAANEKKAKTLITEWRDETLNTETDTDNGIVHQIYCMAHCLLGFKSYGEQRLKSLSEKMDIDIGRDKYPVYKRFGKELPLLRVVRHTSELMGPMGDEKNGIQNKWQAFCRAHNIRSIITSYKDNRFNSVFEGAAQVMHHIHDLLNFLELLGSKNLKVKSLYYDLQDSYVISIIHAAALTYVQITRPFWEFVIQDKVPYISLGEPIQKLKTMVVRWIDNPSEMSKELCEFPYFSPGTNNVNGNAKAEYLTKAALDDHSSIEDKSTFEQTIIALLEGVEKTITMQMADFLPGGKYGNAPTPNELIRTKGAPLNNLICERNFGILDASQNKRRNATFHYHSSILLLKSNKLHLKHWLNSKSSEERHAIWANAHHDGKALRLKHRADEVIQESLEEDDLKPPPPKKRRAKVSNIKPCQPVIRQPVILKVNDHTAVGYENGWWPGQILSIENDNVTILFMKSGRQPGHYTYQDPSVVLLKFCFLKLEDPTITPTGRAYIISDHIKAEIEYQNFKISMNW